MKFNFKITNADAFNPVLLKNENNEKLISNKLNDDLYLNKS